MKIDSFLYTNTGGRDHNEDAVGSCTLPDGELFVVADGLGGHMFGEQASASVVKSLTETSPPDGDTDAAARLEEMIHEANDNLITLQEETRSNMKSTVVTLLLRKNEAHWANVGDSRLYYFHRGELAFVTEDHSVAYKKYKAGEITRAQIATDEDQSSLLRTLGNKDRHQPVLGSAAVAPGDGFLLCSDGLWEYLHDGEVLIDYLKSDSAREWAEQLLLRVIARQTPSSDNLSLITVIVNEGGKQP